MFINYWMDRAMAIIESEVILVKASPNTQAWFNKMTKTLPAICPDSKPSRPEDFAPVVGMAYHLRLTKWGIEAVLKAPRKFQRYESYVLYDVNNQPNEPFWVILRKQT